MLYFVEYRVPALTGGLVHRQGPWPVDEARQELSDIAGYEGVQDADLKPADEEPADGQPK